MFPTFKITRKFILVIENASATNLVKAAVKGFGGLLLDQTLTSSIQGMALDR
jgi:hypothetical protein